MIAEARSHSVSVVARKHNIAPSLLFRWRRELESETAASPKRAEPGFVRVALPAPIASPEFLSGAANGERDSVIEIVLAGNRRVIVGKTVDGAALKHVIDILEGR